MRDSLANEAVHLSVCSSRSAGQALVEVGELGVVVEGREDGGDEGGRLDHEGVVGDELHAHVAYRQRTARCDGSTVDEDNELNTGVCDNLGESCMGQSARKQCC